MSRDDLLDSDDGGRLCGVVGLGQAGGDIGAGR